MYFEKIPFDEIKKSLVNLFPEEYENMRDDYWKYYQVYDDIQLPTRASVGSCGYDIISPISFSLQPNESIVIPTGIRWVTDQQDKTLLIFPRSGLGFKHQCRLANTTGVIDSDYWQSDNYGHIMIKLVNGGDKVMDIESGKAIAQGVILSYCTVDDDNAIGNRNGGFGSSGR